MNTIEIRFLVQGSAAEPYSLTFRRTGNNLTARCTCPGGQSGTQCKHRIAILCACVDNIVSGNTHDVGTVCSWLPGTDVEVAIRRHQEAEALFNRAKRELSEAKKLIAEALAD